MSVDYPQMAATRGRIEPAPRRVRGYLGHVLVFDTSAARYVWEVPYYPQYYIPLADVRMEFLRDENHPQRVQLGPSRLHSLVSAGQTHRSAARVFDVDGDSPVAGTVRFTGIRCGGSRRTSRSTAIRAIPISGPMRCARTDTSVSSWTALCSLTPDRPFCYSKPGYPQGITSIRPTSLSSIWSPPRRRRCVRTRGRRRAIGLCASATPCTATWPGRITIHCPPLPRSPAWWRFTTRRSTSPSTASPCRGRTLSSASAWFVRRLAAASMVNLI